jgi:hypothetical protein
MGALSNLGFGSSLHFPYGVIQNPVAAPGAADVIPVSSGVVFVTRAGVNAMTLALPKAGVYPSGNAQSLGDPRDDGKELTIVSTTAFAHTITTPTNGINKTLHLLTFAAAVGNWVQLISFGGTWYVTGLLGVTIS